MAVLVTGLAWAVCVCVAAAIAHAAPVSFDVVSIKPMSSGPPLSIA